MIGLFYNQISFLESLNLSYGWAEMFIFYTIEIQNERAHKKSKDYVI